MKTYHGIAQNIHNLIVGKITRQKKPLFKRKDYIILCDEKCKNLIGYVGYAGAILTSAPSRSFVKLPMVLCQEAKTIRELKDDDIVSLDSNGNINVLWESESDENVFLLTEQCNCRCLMCPQPPRKDSSELFKTNLKILDLIDPKKTQYVCITGGEPTILGDKFINFLKAYNNKCPESHIMVLTNGTEFSNFEFSKQVAKIGLQNLLICISLHADTNMLHDHITGLEGSFYKTVKGIHNLAKFYQKIEIRFVINKLNYKRLYSFAEFIYKNFPFVIHIAFMGLEITGYAKKNFDKIWIDPIDYSEDLREAVLGLHRRGMNVSVYNIPLCLLSKDIWYFSKKSISNWKNNYLPICNDCEVREMCPGIFTTSAFQSRNIKPINVDNAENGSIMQ